MIELSPVEVERYYASRVPKARMVGSELRAPCPVHSGKNLSFSIDPETGRSHCFSKCARGWDVLSLEQVISGGDFKAALEHVSSIIGRQLAKSRNGASTKPARKRRKVVAEYIYRDEGGAPLYRVRRTDPKGFYQQRWTDGKRVNGLGNTRRALFHLPEVLEAPIVFLVEGERDVETLRKWGFVATTAAGGAGAKWLPEYTDALRGREVIIIPDSDAPGWARAVELSRALVGKVARLVVFDDLPKGVQDLTAWFEAGHSEAELIAILEGVDAV